MLSGAGIGFRPQLAAALLRDPRRVDFVEVVAETCRDPETRREVVALSRVWPVALHGVSLSPGSAEGLDLARVAWLADLARELRAVVVSEHMAFVRAGGREIGHLTELPRTRVAVGVLARNVAILRRHLPDVPILLENPARSFVWTDHDMDEGAFLHEVVAATGCSLLLDVANLHANAVNGEPLALADVPLDRVALVHVAGGRVEDGFWFDTHAHPVADEVFALAASVRGRCAAPMLLERDGDFTDPDAILAEVDRLRALDGGAAALAEAQRTMARLLTNDEPAPGLAHARAILRRKQSQHERTVRSVAVEHGARRPLLALLRDALRGGHDPRAQAR